MKLSFTSSISSFNELYSSSLASAECSVLEYVARNDPNHQSAQVFRESVLAIPVFGTERCANG